MRIVLIAALTADGMIGRDADHLANWTGKADKKVFVQVTKELGTMIMGARTFATIGKALPGRRTIVYTRHPDNITAEGIETTDEPPAELVKRLENEGVHGLAMAGGASIYSLFMEAGLVDELYLTVTPILFGTGVQLFSKTLQTKLDLLESTAIGEGAVLLHYKVAKS